MVNIEYPVDVINFVLQRLGKQPIRLDSYLLATGVTPLDGNRFGTFDVAEIARYAESNLEDRQFTCAGHYLGID